MKHYKQEKHEEQQREREEIQIAYRNMTQEKVSQETGDQVQALNIWT